MFQRRALPALTLLLLLLVLADAVQRTVSHRAEQGASAAPASESEITHSATAAARSPQLDAETGARQVRRAVRQELWSAGRTTYLDSMLLTTDSVVRRWPDRPDRAVRYAYLPGSADGGDARLHLVVQGAVTRWESAQTGMRFVRVEDSSQADITVRWVERFSFDRVGQTDLAWDQKGRVRHAAISLALQTNVGIPLSDAALVAVATHEFGHALGLPHSSDPTDVMFPATRSELLSDRDRRSAELLYRLPPGSVKEAAEAARTQ